MRPSLSSITSSPLPNSKITPRPRKSEVKPSDITSGDAYLLSFRDFAFDKHIQNDKFNNRYQTKKDSVIAARDLLSRLRDLGQHSIREINTTYSRQFHSHKITDSEELNRVIYVLQECLGMPADAIKQFENNFFSCGFGSQGHRLVCHYTPSTLSPLFIDSNHLIYAKSSRKAGTKLNYSIPFLAPAEEKDLGVPIVDIEAKMDMIREELTSLSPTIENIRTIMDIKEGPQQS